VSKEQEYNSAQVQFEEKLARWVVECSQDGYADFWNIVRRLPGSYPSDVRNVITQLIEVSLVEPDFGTEHALASTHDYPGVLMPGTAIPHPLAFDWRFTLISAERVLDELMESSRNDDRVLLLGCPSVYWLGTSKRLPRDFMLLDLHGSVLNDDTNKHERSIQSVDLMKNTLDVPRADVVLADPPWYFDEAMAFLASAAHALVVGGTLLFCYGSHGMRPGAFEEQERLIAFAESLGLEWVNSELLSLSYVTPYFEYNALKAAGFNHIPSHWRKGDLLRFRKNTHNVNRTLVPKGEQSDWFRSCISGIEIWMRRDDCVLETPELIRILPGDILPSVSRRNARRNEAQVWTSGNRVFRCKNIPALFDITQAIERGENPHDRIQAGMAQGKYEVNDNSVGRVVSQIERVVSLEMEELGSIVYGDP